MVRLWKERATRQEYLRSGSGRRFRVIYPGRAGSSAGPDLRDAVLEEEGVGLVRGDVEVRVDQKSWKAHGHNKDPRYNGVVLHVVASQDSLSDTLRSGQQVPVVSIEPLLAQRSGPSRPVDVWSLLGAHGYRRPETSPDMGALLDMAGDARFLAKADHFRMLIEEESPDQVLYASLMEALGYSQNQEPFQKLAYLVPYRELQRVALDRLPEDRVPSVLDLLLAVSRFSSGSSEAPKARTKRRVQPMDPASWHLFRVRPPNHPAQRIRGFAHLLDLFLPIPRSPDIAGAEPQEWMNKDLVEGVRRLLIASWNREEVGKRFRALEEGLVGVRGPGYNAPSDDDQILNIGRGRARDMVVNCVLPFLHAQGLIDGDDALGQLVFSAFRMYPKTQENELTREMRKLLLTSDIAASSPLDKSLLKKTVNSARRQQGLIHLHHLIASPAR